RPRRRPRPVTRRTFLRGSAAALAGAGGLLAGCGRGGPGPPAGARGAAGGSRTRRAAPGGPGAATPEQPIAWPISEDNQPISVGQEPEHDAVLKLYNWTDYLNMDAVRKFERENRASGTKVQVINFDT